MSLLDRYRPTDQGLTLCYTVVIMVTAHLLMLLTDIHSVDDHEKALFHVNGTGVKSRQ